MDASFIPLQRKILAYLEEAGSESFVTVANLTASQQGESEIASLSAALSLLARSGHLNAAIRRDDDGYWFPLSEEESVLLLTRFHLELRWSPSENMWETDESCATDPEVVLTEKGLKAAREVLKRDGWPE